MSGKFTGLSEVQWELLRVLLPPEPERRKRGLPHADFRGVLNTITYVLITGSRWCDVPTGASWGKRATAHRWLGRWMEDGTWSRIQAHLLGAAELAGAIDWERASLDGSFSPRQGGRRRGSLGLQRQRRDAAQPGGGSWPTPGAPIDPR